MILILVASPDEKSQSKKKGEETITKIKCLKCNDILEGDKKGTFIQCKCNSCFIDETEFYCRVGGNLGEIEVINKDIKEEEKVVNTTVTMPLWLKEMARKKGLNFSKILQEKLKQELNIKD